MKIAVGSQNPVKIAAARAVLARIWPPARVEEVAVDSTVSDMPLTEAEAIEGARQRARQAQSLVGADLGIGLEGASAVIDGRQMTAGWAAVFDGKRFGIGGGAHLQLPPQVERKILREGKELGTAIDELIGAENTKQKMGAIGVLTGGLSNRQQAYEYVLIYALIPFISPLIFSSKK